jgi:hypothetical protein
MKVIELDIIMNITSKKEPKTTKTTKIKRPTIQKMQTSVNPKNDRVTTEKIKTSGNLRT